MVYWQWHSFWSFGGIDVSSLGPGGQPGTCAGELEGEVCSRPVTQRVVWRPSDCKSQVDLPLVRPTHQVVILKLSTNHSIYSLHRMNWRVLHRAYINRSIPKRVFFSIGSSTWLQTETVREDGLSFSQSFRSWIPLHTYLPIRRYPT